MRRVVTISNLAIEEFPAVTKLLGVTGGSMAVCTVMIPSVLDNELSAETTTETELLVSAVSFLHAINKKNVAANCKEKCVIFMFRNLKLKGAN